MPFTLNMPKLSPTMEDGTIAVWHKKEGERVEAGDLLFEVATDKATVEHTALDEGWLRKILVQNGGSAVVNQPVAIFSEEENENIDNFQIDEGAQQASDVSSQPIPQPTAISEPQTAEVVGDRILASPLAKKLAKERGIDLRFLRGTGPNKRIMSRDLDTQPTTRPSAQASTLSAGVYTIETLTPVRKVIAQRLQEAKATIPHFYAQMTVDAQPLVHFREQLKNSGVQVSVNDCIVKACALALKEHPAVNSGFNVKDNTLIRYQTVDVAVAVSIAAGLITPIVKHADRKSLAEVSAEIRSLAKRAKDGKLALDEFQGGSFTVSNLGMFGISNFQAIINPPQAAILAVGAILDLPVVKDGVVIAGKVINLTLSVDHRVVDGVAAAEFLSVVKKIVENPVGLILNEN